MKISYAKVSVTPILIASMALSACNPATSDSGDGSTPSEASSGNEVSKDSARVLLSEVGKNVADGVIQVDPSTIQGRILVFDDYSKLEGKKVCIGFTIRRNVLVFISKKIKKQKIIIFLQGIKNFKIVLDA